MIFGVIHTIQFCLLAGMYLIGMPARGDLALSANHRDACSVAVLVDINSKCSRFLHCKRQVRRVDFVQVAFPQFADAKVDCPFGDTHLQDVFIQIQEGKRRHAAQVQGRLTRLQLRA